MTTTERRSDGDHRPRRLAAITFDLLYHVSL